MITVKKQNNVYIIILNKGSEFVETIIDFCLRNNIKAGYFTAIGACNYITLSWYDLENKKYEDHEYVENFEITSLIGNIAMLEGKPIIHAHGTFAGRDLTVIGGHVKKMVVSATCEIRLETFNTSFSRSYDAETGLNLLG